MQKRRTKIEPRKLTGKKVNLTISPKPKQRTSDMVREKTKEITKKGGFWERSGKGVHPKGPKTSLGETSRGKKTLKIRDIKLEWPILMCLRL